MTEIYRNLQVIADILKEINIFLDSYFDRSAIILTLISTIIAIATLIEMKIQRNKTYQPDIVFSNLRLYIDTGITEIDGEKIQDIKYAFIPAGETWDICNSTEKVTIKASDFRRKEFYISLTAYNTGVGVCKNLRCIYPLKSYKKWLKVLMKNNIIKCEEPNNDFWISSSTTSPIGPFAISDTATIIPENFLIPNSKVKYNIKLPYEYYYFLMTIQNLDDFYKIESVGLPKIKLIMKYKDVQGRNFYRLSSIKIKPFSTTVSKKGSIVLIYDISVT